MAAVINDIDTIEQGATWVKNFFFMQADGITPVDTTNAVWRMQVREKVSSSSPVVDINTVNGGIVHDPVTGSVTLKLSASATSALSFKTGVFDIEVEFPDGTVERIWQGNIALNPNVTR